MNHRLLFQAFVVALILGFADGAAPAGRNVVVISDLHMGVGKTDAGDWDPTEDFRWAIALDGFLANIKGRLADTDLVLAGDVLELWQPRADDLCIGNGADYGCTVKEMEKILDRSLDAHGPEIKSLDRFAQDGNCIYFVPGNHDAILVIKKLWKRMRGRFSAGSCVERAADGVWQSSNGKIVIEHGHQMGLDSNGYAKWPNIVHRVDGQDYIERSWGENFVQALFNAEEAALPLIDNLTPHSAGVRYKLEDRGWTGSIQDIATFLRFNLLETSLAQKIRSLGRDEKGKPIWDVNKARDFGHRLYLGSLDPSDPFAVSLRDAPDDTKWGDLRTELDQQAAKLSDEEVRSFCDQLAIRGYKPDCSNESLGGGIESALFSRQHITGKHVKMRADSLKRMELFIYGHTHAFERKWSTPINDSIRVAVINSGAFQRLVDDDRLLSLAAKEGKAPIELLREGSLEGLDACYTFVETNVETVRSARLRAWIMQEDGSPGRLADPCNPACPNSGKGCP